ncbi:unnamed protein product [Callosobruchus maculatus]|uniref:Uncharacterized protein n=1 Tax=Callosobruchus maculatus TaxID=64391 RepID=A0A653D219_CALMS|nr:unnamed protein product [Callosobruchus maculatus]
MTESDEIFSAIITPEGMVVEEIVDTPVGSRPPSPLQPVPGPSRTGQSMPRRLIETPSKKQKREATTLQEVNSTLQSIANKIIVPPLLSPQQRTASTSVADYVASKLETIDKDDIREEIVEEIMSVLHKGLKKFRASKKQ